MKKLHWSYEWWVGWLFFLAVILLGYPAAMFGAYCAGLMGS